MKQESLFLLFASAFIEAIKTGIKVIIIATLIFFAISGVVENLAVVK